MERHRRRRLWVVTAVIALAVVGYGLYWWKVARLWAWTNDAYVTGNVTPIQAQSRGSVSDVLVDNTEYVRKGQVLVRLQGNRARIALARAAGHLGATVRKVRQMMHRVHEERGHLAALSSEVKKLEHDLKRYEQAAPGQGVSAIRIQDAKDQIIIVRHKVDAARSRLEEDRALVKGSTVAQNPLVLEAEAEYLKAWVDRSRLTVRAPVSGFVAQREVYPGMLLRPGAHLLDIVPLTEVWVVANVEETDMGRVRPGQKVDLTADYYGRRVRYDGVVQGLGAGAGSTFSILPAENATGNYIHIVERVPVRIGIDPGQLRAHPLRPGLSMDVHISLQSGGRDINAPLTVTPARGYRTDIYARELESARRSAARIIQDNS